MFEANRKVGVRVVYPSHEVKLRMSVSMVVVYLAASCKALDALAYLSGDIMIQVLYLVVIAFASML